jgi:hypothetical protein
MEYGAVTQISITFNRHCFNMKVQIVQTEMELADLNPERSEVPRFLPTAANVFMSL